LKINPEARIVKDEERIRPEKSEVERLLGSNKKLKTISGWTPKYSLNDGLTETIDWFKKSDNLRNYKAGLYNI
jgi:nucleoside-diphosphate-sugar epimerase